MEIRATKPRDREHHRCSAGSGLHTSCPGSPAPASRWRIVLMLVGAASFVHACCRTPSSAYGSVPGDRPGEPAPAPSADDIPDSRVSSRPDVNVGESEEEQLHVPDVVWGPLRTLAAAAFEAGSGLHDCSSFEVPDIVALRNDPHVVESLEAIREWIDSFWAKDLQELFAVERKAAFLKFMELLLHQSGELFEATSFAAACEVSRQTIVNYLEILTTTLTATVLRPYAGASPAEIKSQPKVYAFDTGFVCYFHEWTSLRAEDRGHLLEHLVLNELLAHLPPERVFYWRDKQRHEVDFVVRPMRGAKPVAIEAKSRSTAFDVAGLRAFRGRHPEGPNLVVCLDLAEPSTRRAGGLEVRFVPFAHFDEELVTLTAGGKQPPTPP
ncbi:MAG: DUF4143 domain-containing protein [Deltaproteobacteria bacterium]|nr:DUF4143 domain-containing protein [Deltaproteobacteria bacterium]